MKSEHYLNHRPPLRPGAFVALPLGAVKPRGWLRDQLRVQANGLTGHLEEFWPDLGPRNMWLGGDLEGWERGPYYLDGLTPLAYLLEDAGLIARARRWIEAILAFQDDSGWLGPVQAPGRQPYDVWPVAIALKALTQFHEATGDARVLDRMLRFAGWLRENLEARPLFQWGRHRWQDLVLSLHWLYDRTGEPWLLDVTAALRRQGYDWTEHFTRFPYREKTPRSACTLDTHVVNGAMGIKAPGVWWLQSGDETDRQAVYRALEYLDRYHGQVTGVFTGDEHYAGLDPTQGTELCAVVEYLFSLETLLAILGDAALADRLERIAYNALPATFSADMWAHQYDQQVNQVLCTAAPRHWVNNGPEANLFGVEPNYGCCTANMHQGWPKLAKSLWMAAGDGLAAGAYAPCAVTARVADGRAVTIIEETEYPFRGTIRFTIQTDTPVRFPLMLRVPGWATSGARLTGAGWSQGSEDGVQGSGDRVQRLGNPEPRTLNPDSTRHPAPTFLTLDREWQPGETVTLELPMPVRVEQRHRGAVSLMRGPLIFGLRIGEEWRRLRGEPPHADWEIAPTTPWNYGLALDPARSEAAITVREAPIGSVPFRPEDAPVVLTAPARRIPEWTLANHSAGPTPESPVEVATPVETVELIPYGSTHLRIAEFPVVEP